MSIATLFTQLPTLTTERLVLREVRPDDAEAIFATLGDETVMEFMGNAAHQSLEESKRYVRQLQNWYRERVLVRWMITLKGEDRYIGSCGLHRFDIESNRAEAGYELNRAYWHQGIMTEALSAILSYSFQEVGLHRIEAITDVPNSRSQGLLRKLGFTYEGTLRQRFYFNNEYLDEVFFGLLKHEWSPIT